MSQGSINGRFVRTVALMLAVAPVLLGVGCKGKYIRATTAEKFEATPERLQRGQYLVNQLLACGACHTSRATGAIFMEGEQTDHFLAGGNVFDDPPLGRIYVPNITPDPEGLGAWTDDEILRALRDGIDKNGRFMVPLMPYNAYKHLSDDDGKAVIVYLRSVPPAKAPRPRFDSELKLMPRLLFTTFGVQMHKPASNPVPVDKTDRAAYGRYVMQVAACSECHSLGERGPHKEGDPLYMAGSDAAFEEPGFGKIWARNLTPDPETGLGKYTAAQIKAAFRDGKRLDGRRMAPPMAALMPHLSGITDEDLDALVAQLVALKPAKHAVREPELTAEAQKLVTP